MRTELSLYVDGSRFKCEQYGNIMNSEKIVLFCHGFPKGIVDLEKYGNTNRILLKTDVKKILDNTSK